MLTYHNHKITEVMTASQIQDILVIRSCKLKSKAKQDRVKLNTENHLTVFKAKHLLLVSN